VANQVAALAQALEEGQTEALPASSTATSEVQIPEKTSAPGLSSPSLKPTFVLTETPTAAPIEETLQPLPSPIPRPTKTSVPTQAVPYKLTGQDEVCDPNLPDGLLQVIVLSSNRRQVPGMEINITWENGEEKFFTGLKPDQGNGYADFIMTPDVPYSVQLAAGSDMAAGLVAPACQNPGGENFSGGIKLTFQQP
jgi:hypothetical protein